MFNDKKVSISIGGGLGDAIQTYLANPESHCSDGDNNYPTTNHQASLWFRRLRSFKTEFPDVEVALISTSHNPVTVELFETNPYIDRIFQAEWTPHSTYRLWNIESVEYANADSSVDIEMEYNPIHWFYDYQDFEVDIKDGEHPDLYLTDDEINSLLVFGDNYVIFHAEAPKPRDIMPINKYNELKEILHKDWVYSHFVYGGGRSVRVSVKVILNSRGFAGVHSSMWLPAVWAGWKYGIKTACFIPKIPHFKRIKGSAVAWGFNQPFNKTWEYYNYYEASKQDMGEVAEWLLS